MMFEKKVSKREMDNALYGLRRACIWSEPTEVDHMIVKHGFALPPTVTTKDMIQLILDHLGLELKLEGETKAVPAKPSRPVLKKREADVGRSGIPVGARLFGDWFMGNSGPFKLSYSWNTPQSVSPMEKPETTKADPPKPKRQTKRKSKKRGRRDR